MKKQMILEKWKSKTMAMLMALTMVFAMTPLGAGVAFAGEEDAGAADDVVVSAEDVVTEDVVIEEEEGFEAEAEEAVPEDAPAVEEPAANEEEPVVEAAAVNAGYYVFDLSKGPKTMKINMKEMMTAANPFATEYLMVMYYISIFSDQSEDTLGYFAFAPDPDNQFLVHLDLDKNGSTDVDMRAILDETEPVLESGEPNVVAVIFEQAKTRSVFGTKTFTLPEKYLDLMRQTTEMEKYYTGIKFVLAKKANTLNVAGKTVNIKYKKLKKNAKTLKVGQVISITKKGQGAVTYAKKSGNKKIKIAKNGTVTVKKKLKKGKYTVKVNVTAAGNATYNKVTKTVKITIKVK